MHRRDVSHCNRSLRTSVNAGQTRSLAGFGIVLACLFALVPGAASANKRDRTSEAQGLVRDGVNRYSEGTLEQRRTALRQLEQAAKLTPNDPAALLPLGHAYLDAGFAHSATETFERVTREHPMQPDGWEGLGLAWKRDWLATLAPSSLQQAVECFGNAARLDPARARTWAVLAVLRVEQGDLRGAVLSAERALAADSVTTEASLVAAYLAYRAGRVALSESLFTATFPRLAPRLAARFRDVTPLVTAFDGEELEELSPRARDEYARRFWSAADPDPTTVANEARVEYWARVAHAIMLFSDSWDAHWDMRAELYVRYGSPERVAYEPPGRALAKRMNRFTIMKFDALAGSRPVGEVPAFYSEIHNQVWDYPQLGMRVVLEDRTLSQRYELPREVYASTEPVPNEQTMERNGLVSASGGRAAFAKLPPGVTPLPILTGVSTFESDRGAVLLAHVSAPAREHPDLIAECVVVDSSEHEVARQQRPLGVARCDPGVLRAGDFAFDLPPGPYRVAIAVSDGQGARGVRRTYHDVVAPERTLSMSALLLVCGPLDAARGTSSVRLDPDLDATIAADEPLLAYFEVYRLQPDPQGVTLFDYEYTVRPVRGESNPLRKLFPKQWSDQISVRSPADGTSPTRRQYITVPMQSLPPGRYKLEVSVHDRLGRRNTHRSIEFTKQAVPPAAEGPSESRALPDGATESR